VINVAGMVGVPAGIVLFAEASRGSATRRDVSLWRRARGPRHARVDKRKQAKHRNVAECLAAANHG
jgi:hypothetical protein